MDFKVLDGARRNAGPLQVDLVEAYASGRLSRRNFVKRGTVLGLSVPFMSTIIAACGSDAKTTPTTAAATAGSTAGSTGATTATTAGAAGTPVKGGNLKIASQTPSGPLDPVAMADLGSYGIVAQSFEFLCALGDGDIAPGLALSWSPNTDGSVWTFKLRTGVKWQNSASGAFTADDVVATMERLVAAKNAGLNGVLAAGGCVAKDPSTVEFTLTAANGLFPYLVSVYNAQTVITPKAYATGTAFEASPDGTGPWKLTKYDKSTGATFVPNTDWWGGSVFLDQVDWVFSDDISTQVSGVVGGATDAIVQFAAVGGDALLNSSDFTVINSRTANHREIWMRCDKGQFTDKRVRQAFALCLDRDLMNQQLFKGTADIGNDHPIAPVYPYFDDSVPQRKKDIEGAKKLLAAAGVTSLKAVLNAPKLQEIPELAVLVQNAAKDIGWDLTLNIESTDTFYNEWCLTYDPICDGGQEFGIVDYGHRATPDVYLNAAYATGTWNSAHYKSDDFNAAFKEYQAALDVDGHKAACKKLETIANEDVPYAIPYFYPSLAAVSKKFTGVRVSALGQMFVDTAGKVS
ncbi:MAG: putative oligopeptide transporter oligopeptide-binding protein [Acidimicrobiales bacterium]|nr:putative oligopeptide transporter oligopeptide-binding protein [Acidimicrobiales bacterium]